MRFLPLFLDTAAGVVLLVGSGEPALGKLRLLRAAGAHVRWFSRAIDIAEEMLTLSGEGRLEISFGDALNADSRLRLACGRHAISGKTSSQVPLPRQPSPDVPRRRRRNSWPRSTAMPLAKAAPMAKPKPCFWSALVRAIPTF